MKRYRLNTTVNKYSVGDIVSEGEIKEFLNIPQCLQCAWLIPDTPEQTTKEGFVWTDELVREFINFKYDRFANKTPIEQFKAIKASKQSLSNTPVFDAEKINQRIEQLAEMEEVFNAARERKYIKDPSIRTISDFTHDFQYKTFSEYLSSIKKQQSK